LSLFSIKHWVIPEIHHKGWSPGDRPRPRHNSILLVHIKRKFRIYSSTTVSNQQVEVTLLSTTV